MPTDLTRRYDALLYIDNTYALHPLHMPEVKDDVDLPESSSTDSIYYIMIMTLAQKNILND